MNKRKTGLLAFMTAVLLVIAGVAGAMTEKLTAGEWQKLSRQRKIYFTLGSMEAEQQNGRIFYHTMDQLIQEMDKRTKDRSAAATSMDQVFLEVASSLEKDIKPKSEEEMEVL